MGDLIELKPNVSKDKQECFEDLIKEVSKHKIKGFIVLVPIGEIGHAGRK